MINFIKKHIEFRRLIFKLAKSDLIKTYRGSALGWFWAIIKPSVTIFVYWFVFSVGLRAGRDVNGFPFFLWLISGLIPWFYMSEMLTQGMDSIRRYSYLVTKMKFPVVTIPTFVSLSKIFVHLILVLVMTLIFLLFKYPIDIYYLQLLFYLPAMFIFFTVLTLFTSSVSAISKDFQNFVRSFITAIFWLSGILWDVSNVQNVFVRNLLRINPVTYFAEGYRNIFINKVWFFETKTTIAFLIILFITYAISVKMFKKLEKEIPDVL